MSQGEEAIHCISLSQACRCLCRSDAACNGNLDGPRVERSSPGTRIVSLTHSLAHTHTHTRADILQARAHTHSPSTPFAHFDERLRHGDSGGGDCDDDDDAAASLCSCCDVLLPFSWQYCTHEPSCCVLLLQSLLQTRFSLFLSILFQCSLTLSLPLLRLHHRVLFPSFRSLAAAAKAPGAHTHDARAIAIKWTHGWP